MEYLEGKTLKERLAAQDTQDSEAKQLYMKGLYYWNKRTLENLERAITCFKQACGKGPWIRPGPCGLG